MMAGVIVVRQVALRRVASRVLRVPGGIGRPLLGRY